MKLQRSDAEMLQQARIGMLALNGHTAPVVGASAYYYSLGSIWMTTSRYAQKVRLIQHDPRASFLVALGDRTLLLQGIAEVFDLRSVNGQLRAALHGPGFYSSLAGYAMKNLRFIGGYLLELDRVPGQWWPQNRLVLRVRIDRHRDFETPSGLTPDPARVPGLRREVARRLARVPLGVVCWKGRGGLLLHPCYWATEDDSFVIGFPAENGGGIHDGAAVALLVEKHHPFRPTHMVGASFRGRITEEPHPDVLLERYSISNDELSAAFRLKPDRVTSWHGFESESH